MKKIHVLLFCLLFIISIDVDALSLNIYEVPINYDTIVDDLDITTKSDMNKLKEVAEEIVNNNKKVLKKQVKETNKYRDEVGVSLLEYDHDLSVAATMRAIEITDYFSHTRPNGTRCFSILSDLGITYRAVGENIAYGYNTVKDVSSGWKNSSGHYANMINKNYNKIGVGEYAYNDTNYWVQIFSD